jgi:hypothetical protein
VRRQPVAGLDHLARRFRVEAFVGIADRRTPEAEEKGEAGQQDEGQDGSTHRPSFYP